MLSSENEMTELGAMRGPGFVSALFDIPFPLAIPNGGYLCYDPVKGVACIESTLREGSRAFFRNRPIVKSTTFEELKAAAKERERPRKDRDYLVVSELSNAQKKVTLNINSGIEGGYVECKYYTEVSVTFLVDDLSAEGDQKLERAFNILNPLLDKYRLFTQDHRVGRVSKEKNYYFVMFHTNPLMSDELHLSPSELFQRLQIARTFLSELGKGASNSLRLNSYETLGPRSPLPDPALNLFGSFIKEQYEMPLFYDLLLESLDYLQGRKEYRLAIVQAETAVEVYVRESLLKLMTYFGKSLQEASSVLPQLKLECSPLQ